MLSQLSYTPAPGPLTATRPPMVGLGRFELPTSRLSGVRSNRLSYRPLALGPCGVLPPRRRAQEPRHRRRPRIGRTLRTCAMTGWPDDAHCPLTAYPPAFGGNRKGCADGARRTVVACLEASDEVKLPRSSLERR